MTKCWTNQEIPFDHNFTLTTFDDHGEHKTPFNSKDIAREYYALADEYSDLNHFPSPILTNNQTNQVITLEGMWRDKQHASIHP